MKEGKKEEMKIYTSTFKKKVQTTKWISSKSVAV